MDDEAAAVCSGLRDEGLRLGRSGLGTDTNQEVGAAVHPSGVFVGWLDVAWPHPATPATVLEGVVHVPTPLDEAPRAELRTALRRARKERTRRLRVCSLCRESLVPGRMHAKDICQGGAGRHRGVVH